MKGLKFLVIFLLIAIPPCSAWWYSYRQGNFQELLPKKIEIVGAILTADIGIDTCFFAVYKLSDQTLNKINQEGLTFFKNETKSRVYEYNPKHIQHTTYHLYKEWQKTPIQKSQQNKNFGSGIDSGIECAKENGFDNSLLEKIQMASEDKGSFYTEHQQGHLIIIPRLGISVLSGLGD